MPVSFHVILIPEKPVSSNELTPDRIHGIFHSLLGDSLSKEIHDIKGLKPYSLSYPPFFGRQRQIERIRLGISFLIDELFPRFLSSFVLGNSIIKLGDITLKKVKKPLVNENNIKSYHTIYDESEPSRDIILDFLTPTSFKRGNYDYPLPDPLLIFRGLIRKWQSFSDLKIDCDLREVISSKTMVTGAWIRTKKVEFSSLGKFTGFTGRVVLHVDERRKEVLKWLNALCRFADFSGVGRKTTMGFGSVRKQDPLISKEGNVSFDEELNIT